MERLLIYDAAGDCEILIGGGASNQVLPQRPGRARVALLSQPASNPIAMRIAAGIEAAGIEAAVRVVPDREAAKTMQVAEDCYLWMNSIGLTRGDTVVAVGGGAVTDLGGFIGATYLRGVETVLVPTTLLGAVDAAIGGKTAVNVGGKNLAGVFRHPARVAVDIDVLAGLPAELMIEGSAEAVKAGFIADTELVELYEAHGPAAPLEEVVVRAVKVKADVVNSDFTEQGRRAILNYGHTVGHALEHVAGMAHGHAVAVGMVAAGAASAAAAGFTGGERQTAILRRIGLPTAAPTVDATAVRDAMDLDKKRDHTGLRMVLLEQFGAPIVQTVDATTVTAALQAVGIQ